MHVDHRLSVLIMSPLPNLPVRELLGSTRPPTQTR
jgi:hypothetical protein